MPQCRGRHPHLGQASEPCGEQLRTLVLGASNLWFNSSVSVLSLPVGGGSLAQLVYDHWDEFSKMPVKDVLGYALSADRAARSRVRRVTTPTRSGTRSRPAEPAAGRPHGTDVLGPEWAALTTGSHGADVAALRGRTHRRAAGFAGKLAGVTLAHRLRVVTATVRVHPHQRRRTRRRAWHRPARDQAAHRPGCPVVENRGEGIFLRLDETAVQTWEADRLRQPGVRRDAARPPRVALRRAASIPVRDGPASATCCCTRSRTRSSTNSPSSAATRPRRISERIYSRRPATAPSRWPASSSTPPRPTPRARSAGSSTSASRRARPDPAAAPSNEPGCAAPTRSAPTTNPTPPPARSTALPATPASSSPRPAASVATATSTVRPRRHLPPHRPGVLRLSDLADAIAAVVARARRRPHRTRLAPTCCAMSAYSRRGARGDGKARPRACTTTRSTGSTSAWAVAAGHCPAHSIALALESALAAQRRADGSRRRGRGHRPDSPAAPVRLTSEVVRQLIDQRHSRVTLVSYAAYQMPVGHRRARRCRRTRSEGRPHPRVAREPRRRGRGGTPTRSTAPTTGPLDHREPPDAKLHAKAVIVDGRDVLLTSANMTNAAYDKNIELGVLCRGGGVAGQVQRHFDALITSRHPHRQAVASCGHADVVRSCDALRGAERAACRLRCQAVSAIRRSTSRQNLSNDGAPDLAASRSNR